MCIYLCHNRLRDLRVYKSIIITRLGGSVLRSEGRSLPLSGVGLGARKGVRLSSGLSRFLDSSMIKSKSSTRLHLQGVYPSSS